LLPQDVATLIHFLVAQKASLTTLYLRYGYGIWLRIPAGLATLIAISPNNVSK